MRNSIQNVLDKISRLMVARLGFSSDAAQRQLHEVEKIIFSAIVKRLFSEEKSAPHITSAKDIERYLASYVDEQKLARVIEEESTRVLGDYFSTVTTSLSDGDRATFFSSLQSIVAEKN